MEQGELATLLFETSMCPVDRLLAWEGGVVQVKTLLDNLDQMEPVFQKTVVVVQWLSN